jgi:hypothetical protein
VVEEKEEGVGEYRRSLLWIEHCLGVLSSRLVPASYGFWKTHRRVDGDILLRGQ